MGNFSKKFFGVLAGEVNSPRSEWNEGCNLIITVDNGIAAVDEIEFAKSLGMDVVVTDHHMPQNEIPDCTKIIIAQRISSVKDADTIIVMNDGKITGIGTHEELLINNAEYGEIYYSQMDKKEA